jgi:hypothetical protein
MINSSVEQKQAQAMYSRQKGNAKRRGIAWEFTFETWMQLWGDDLIKRGKYHHNLCMQRFGDTGPYSPTNVKKDFAMENARTRGVIVRAKNTYRPAKDTDWNSICDAFGV